MSDQSIEVIVPPSFGAGQIYRVVGREKHAVPERWDVTAGAWVHTTKTSLLIARMPAAGPELLARLGIGGDAGELVA